MPVATHEERVGTLLGGRYRLEGILGRGGMGAVFDARHALTGRPVAVKTLNHEYAGQREVVRRFLREARLAAEIKHPNVIDVLDMGEEPDGTVYIVLERLDGESLARRLAREGSLELAEAASILVPVMRALAYAHAHGVIHRDLKPENIFLHRDGITLVPKVLDFGIAKALGDKHGSWVTHARVVMGTPAYMSPEQAEGIPERVGPPADVWSMGVTWYETLTGAVPFLGETAVATILAINYADYVPIAERLPSLPAPIGAVIDRSLARDPAKRYADMGAFLEAFEEAVAASDVRPTIPASSPTAPPVSAPKPRVSVHAGDAHDELPARRRSEREARASRWLVSIMMAVVGAATSWFALRRAGRAPPAPEALVAPQRPRDTEPPPPTPVTEVPPAPLTPSLTTCCDEGLATPVLYVEPPRDASVRAEPATTAAPPAHRVRRPVRPRRPLPAWNAPIRDYELAP